MHVKFERPALAAPSLSVFIPDGRHGVAKPTGVPSALWSKPNLYRHPLIQDTKKCVMDQ